jgi:thiamine biosynthesis lipoprotein
VIFFLCSIGGGAANASETITFTGRAMGTGWSVKFVQPRTPLISADVERAVIERLEELEQLFSTYRRQSALSRFNALQHTEWEPVAPELAIVASESREVSRITGGAFDVTVYPLVQLWGFGSRHRSGTVPSTAEIAVARARVDWRRLEVQLSPPALRKTEPSVSADFSSMAKGFSADSISDLLTELGAPDHLVQVGGDLKSGGSKIRDEGWHAAIEQPVGDARAIACVLVLTGEALSTSGDYRNFFHVGRQRFGHIIDPRTGQPPASGLASVSVVHASCAMSSALATGLFVLGPEEGYRLALAHGLACLFQVRNGTELVRRSTPEFDRLLQ